MLISQLSSRVTSLAACDCSHWVIPCRAMDATAPPNLHLITQTSPRPDHGVTSSPSSLLSAIVCLHWTPNGGINFPWWSDANQRSTSTVCTLVPLSSHTLPLTQDDMAQEVRAVAWQSEACRFDPTLGVSKCPWARRLTHNCSWRAGWYLAWQPIAVGVWMCVWMGEWEA